MLTFNQKIKALRAIAIQNGENPEIRLSYEMHKKARKEAFSVYWLPYRVYYDYLRKCVHEPTNKLMLNPCFPMPGYPIDAVMKVTEDDFELSAEDRNGSREDVYTFEHLKPEVREQVANIKARYCPWGKGEAFNAEWKKYFYRFLSNYDFKSFTCFDFFGCASGEVANPTTGVVDNTFAELLKNVYCRHKAELDADPDKYVYDIPEDKPENVYLYTPEPFSLIMSRDDAQAKLEIYKNMHFPISAEAEEAFYRLHGVSVYK